MTYVSNHTNDCAARDAIRSELWAQMAEFERKAGPVQTAPIGYRNADGQPVQIVISAASSATLRPAKRRGRPALDVSKHHDLRKAIVAFMRENRVQQCQVAKHLGIKAVHVSNVLNGYKGATEQYMMALMDAAQYIAANAELFKLPKRKWAARAEMVRLIEAHGLNKAAIKRACGWPGNYVYEALRAEIVPNDDRAEIMERVIRQMVEVVK
jgi:predicted transcriptional regulator